MLNKIIKDESGQGVLEYIILTSLIGIFCLVVVKQFGSVLQTRINFMKEEVVRNIPLQ